MYTAVAVLYPSALASNITLPMKILQAANLMVHIVEDWFGSRIVRAVENQFSPQIRQSFGAA